MGIGTQRPAAATDSTQSASPSHTHPCCSALGMHGSRTTRDFPLHLHPQPVVAWATAAGLLLPTAIFYIADAFLDASAWQWLGPTQKHSDSTSEAERTGAFVLHPRNAYSSHAQTAAGSYMLSRAYTGARASVASVAYGAVLFLMGIVSFVWWARAGTQRNDLTPG